MTFCKRIIAALSIFGMATVLSACENQDPPPWDEDDLLKHAHSMANAGKAYAVHDVCMPMIEADEETSERLSLAIGAKRYTQLQKMDVQSEYDRLIAYYRKIGGTDDQIEILETSFSDEYDLAVEQLTSLDVCETTVTDFHNTILNTRVRQL
jgi:hypothetical protein